MMHEYVGKDRTEFNMNYSLRTNVYMELACTISKMAKCTRRQVGAVLTNQEGAILAIGYNGTSRGMRNCTLGGCPRGERTDDPKEKPAICFGAHAEMNCIIHAAKHGRLDKEMILYITLQPCDACLPHLINAGVKKIYFIKGYYQKKYPNYFHEMCAKADVEHIRMEDVDPLQLEIPPNFLSDAISGGLSTADVFRHVIEHINICTNHANPIIKPELKRLSKLLREITIGRFES